MTKSILIPLVILFFSCNPTPKSEVDKIDVSKSPIVEIDSSGNKSRPESLSQNNDQKSKMAAKCDSGVLLTILENVDDLDSAMVSDLLRTIDSSCKNNVEFSEFSNEMLFKVLEKRPDLFVDSYLNLRTDIDTAYILFDLRSPINDLIPITEIIENIKHLKFEKETKKLILENLQKGDWTK